MKNENSRWEIQEAELDTEKAQRLLQNGWEPFSAILRSEDRGEYGDSCRHHVEMVEFVQILFRRMVIN